MCFVLKNYHNFKSCQNMLITLRFNLLYYKLWLCIKHVYIASNLHVTSDSWTSNRPKISIILGNFSNYKFLIFKMFFMHYYKTYPLSTTHIHLNWNEWIGPHKNHYTFITYTKSWLLVNHFHRKSTTIPLHYAA
jgi:hypothetical protein